MEPISSAEMNIIDTNCEYFGLSRLQLMENAGRALAEEVKKRFDHGKVVIVAGRGNNGGDAFVMARHLNGFKIEIYLLGRKSDIKTSEAMRNFKILEESGYSIKEIRDSSLFPELDGDIIVDAVLGTGVKGFLAGMERKAVEEINSADSFTLAVDLPTGLNPDTGEAEYAVEADLTVTFHKPKAGLLKKEARKYVGELVVAGIGIPESLEKLVGVGEVKYAYRRYERAHKGQHGRILIVGGGEYTGAPALTAMASLYSGADLAVVACPERISQILSSFSPNMIVRPYSGDRLTPEAVAEIEPYLSKADVVVIGMGLGKNKETFEAVREIVSKAERAVIDADALYSIEEPFENKVILTPHEGEFERAFKPDNGWNCTQDEKEYWVKKIAKELNAVVLLKNPQDIISDGRKIKINKTGNAGMTVGGTGDVLAGVIASFFAISKEPFISASAGAFVTGLAGDIAGEKMGYNFTAVEVAREIPEAIKRSLEF